MHLIYTLDAAFVGNKLRLRPTGVDVLEPVWTPLGQSYLFICFFIIQIVNVAYTQKMKN